MNRISEIDSMSANDKEIIEEGELVSIIIPVYNGQKYLKDTIESCRNQSYNNLEIILINDASTDNSHNIIENICKKDNRISYFQNKSNNGIIKTVNYGIEMSKGKYVLCLGQDDLLRPDHIKIMIKHMKPEIAAVFCQSDLINSKGKIFEVHEQLKKKTVDIFQLSKGNRINSCGLVMSKKHLDLVNAFTEIDDFPNYGEWGLWIKLASVGQIIYTDKVKSLYRRHGNNISGTFYNYKVRKKLWKYYSHCRKSAKLLGKFSNKEKIMYSLYSVIFVIKFIYRSIVGERRIWRINN